MKLYITLDLQFFAGEKTEKASPKKRQDARKKGQVLKSQDVSAAILLLIMFIFIFFYARFIYERLHNLTENFLVNDIFIQITSIEIAIEIYAEVLIEMAFMVLPVMAVAVIAGVGANYLQFGFLFTVLFELFLSVL